MSERIDERLRRMEQNYRIINGKFIDQFSTVIDRRTTEEILSRQPKCVVAHRMKGDCHDNK